MPDEHLDALDESARAEGWRQSLESGSGWVFVAVLDDEVVGFAALMPSRDPDASPRCGEVTAIYALPHVWGDGVGWALMDRVLQILSAEGFDEVTLWVLAGNERAIRFYERSDFAHDGAEKTDDSRGFALHELRYRRPLTDT